MGNYPDAIDNLLRRIGSEPALDDVPELIEADRFKRELTTDPEADYKWVAEYARYSLDRATAIFKILDDKASDIIKNLGGGTGLLALGSVATASPANVGTLAAFIPSFAMAMASIVYASMARGPNDARELPTVATAIRYVEAFGPASQSNFLGHWNYIIEAMYEVIARKANRVELATRFYVGAIACLSLPVLVTIFRHAW